MTIDISRGLNFDPFQGDFGDQGDTILSDKIVTARRDYDGCHTCGGVAKAGTKNRVQVARIEGDLMTHRWCQDCTQAMALVDARLSGEDPDWDAETSGEDAEHPYESRVNLRRDRST